MKHLLLLLLLRLKNKLLLPLLWLLLMAVSMTGQGQILTLDQADLDYAPGETVYISGTEFGAGEVVTMTISHIEPGLPLIYHEHAVFYATADEEGNFDASWYVEDVELNTTLSLLAEGDQGSLASIVFTDGGVFDFSPANETISLNAGETGTLSVSVIAPKNNDTFTTTLSFSGIAYGIGANQINLTSISQKYVTTSGNDGHGDTQTFPITVSVGSGVPIGTYNFVASATGTPDVQKGPVPNSKDWTFSVIVGNGSTPGSIQSVSIGTQSGVPVYGTASTTSFSITSSRATSGTVNGTYSVEGLPLGVTSGFSLVSFTSTGGNVFPGTTLTLNVPANLGAGSYPFQVWLKDGASQAVTSGTLVVSKADQTITFTPISPKTYGDPEFSLNATSSTGWPLSYTSSNASVATISGGTVTIIGAGSTTITASQEGNVNYNEATNVQQTLVVNKAVLTVTADNQTKVYGEPNPILTFKFSGWVNGLETIDTPPSISTTVTSASNAGSYSEAIVLTGGVDNNYNFNLVAGSMNVNARPVTITADALSKVYGNADPTLTYQITSGSLAFTDAFTGALTRSPGENVGTYQITQGTVTLSNNYSLTYVSANLGITVRPVTITADALSKVYGNVDPALTYQVTSGSLAFTDAFTGALSRVAGEDVGTYAIGQGTVVLSNNYTLTYVSANLGITARPVTITAEAKSKTYGDPDPALTYQIISGSLAFTDAFTGTLSRVPGESVGSYAIGQGTVALNNNYTLSYVGKDFSIIKRLVTITADAKSKTYGDPDPALTYQITSGSLAFSDAFTGTLARTAGEAVSNYPITQGTVALNSNYTLSYVPADLTINKRAVTISADAKSKTYGDTDPALTYQITSGSLAFSDAFLGLLSRESGENVGNYEIGQGTVALNSNYTLSYVPADLTINKRAVTITADPLSKTYGDPDPALTYQITSGSLAFTDAFTGNLTRTSGENIGVYAIGQGTVALNSNYTLIYVPADLTINKRLVTITAEAKSKVYGDLDPALTFSITSGSLAFSDAFAGSLSRDAGESVADYAITQGTVTLNGNYTLSYIPANLTIYKRAITITAEAKSKIYGDADPGFTYHISSGSLAFSDAFTGTLVRTAGEAVGNYPITQGTVALNSNYTLSYISASLTINKRLVAITANAKSKTYGDLDPALTYQITSGSLAFTDAFTGSLTRASGENIGVYAIGQGTVALNDNYTLSYVGKDFSIIKRLVTITADAKSKTYGDPDPALTYQITSGSLAFTDAFTGALSRVAGEDVGTYAIGQGTVALNDNYTLSYVGKDFSILKRLVIITADAKSKTYGDFDPALTYSITLGSLAFSDAFTGSLTRDAGENIGAYAITQGSVALNSNYTLSYVPADLTITARLVTITADALSKVYGNDDPAFTYEITSGSLAFTDTFTGALTRVSGENIGVYAITQGSVALNSNYTLSYVSADFTINKRAVTITADANSKTYGDLDPVLTYLITSGSLAFNDAFTGSLSRDAGESVGNYSIKQGTVALSNNYTLTYVSANLGITARPVTITADALSKYIGQVDPPLTYQITSGNLVYGDTFRGSLSRAIGECAGTYAISQNSVALSSNYTLGYIGANFTITGVSIDASQSSTPVPTGSTATLSATVTPAAADIAVTFTLDNGVNNVGNPITVYTSSSGVATTTVSNLPVEVYKVTASIGNCASTTAYLAVYDPNGGFVTGGGWITSPAGAYLPNTALTGKANFGFVSKYKKGNNIPEGNTEFQFQTGNLNFSSSSYSAGSLVIAGSQAIYKGVGTINGAGSYGFMVSAVDGQINGGGNIDKFRIKIWDKATGATVYDNNVNIAENATPTTTLGGGSIVIHDATNKTKVAQILQEAPVAAPAFEPTLKAYPNPFTERLNIEFSYQTDTRAKLEIYSMTGAKLETLYDGPVAGGQLYNFEYLPRLTSSQVVFYHLTLDGKTQVGKLLFNENR